LRGGRRLTEKIKRAPAYKVDGCNLKRYIERIPGYIKADVNDRVELLGSN
jgi:hypothetical protein